MVKYSTNINKTKNHLSSQVIEHWTQKDHTNCRWKSIFWLGTGTTMWRN